MSVLLELTDITIPKVGKRKSIKERLIDSIQKETIFKTLNITTTIYSITSHMMSNINSINTLVTL